MTHREFKRIGYELATGWGKDDKGDLNDFIKNLSADESCRCLLAAVVAELVHLSRSIDRIETLLQTQKGKLKDTPVERDCMADGFLFAFGLHTGDIDLATLDRSTLGKRASRILMKSGFTRKSQLSMDSLMKVSQCGETTARELLRWAGYSDVGDLG